MPTILLALFMAFLLISSPCESLAAPLKTYVAEFSVVGAPNKDELKVTLQGLLSSRLNPNQTQLVDKPDTAELLLTGSYALFGKMFSVDVLIKNTVNGAMTKVFEQGESQDDLLPAFGRLAQKLDHELAKTHTMAVAPPPVLPAAPPLPAPVVAKTVSPSAAYKVEAPAVKAEEGYVVKSVLPSRNTPGHWTSDPITGVFTSIALGRTLPSGEREIFVAGEHSVRCFRKGTELKQVAEIPIPVPSKVLAIDTADLDHDGIPELYVSIVDRKTISSRIYQPVDSGLELLADNQPWLYRGIGHDLKGRTISAQSVTADGDYFNEVCELVKSGNRFDTVNSRTLPQPGNIYNSTRFRDASGVVKVAIMDGDGYLVIYAADGGELWKSSDKYGGSETFFNYDTVAQQRPKGNDYQRNFLEQRITALPDGTLIVPHNYGGISIGNNRSYNKYTLFGLEWTGAILREAWHTTQTPSYLADYAYDAATREVVLLEVVQKAGLFGTGKTVISINKLD